MIPPSIPAPDVLKGVDELIREGLEKFRDSWFSWLLWSAGVVALGVLLEGPEVFHETEAVFRRWFGTSTREKHTPSWITLIALLGWILVALGVAGEVVAEGFVSKADGIAQTFNDILLTEAKRQTAFAVERSAVANDRAATNEMEAAGLRKDAESERLARVKIQARVAWRHLTDKQKAEIGIGLGDFANQEGASFWYEAGDTESEMFAADIAEAVRAAHVVVQPPAGMVVMRESGRFGDPIKRADTGVNLQSTKDERSRSLAEDIVRELTLCGFDAVRLKDPPFEDKPVPQVWVNIGPRPEGPQGEFKLQAEREAKTKRKARQK